MSVILTTDERQLEQIRLAHVQAVIYEPSELPKWFEELANAVECGAFRFQRTILNDVGYNQIEAWLEASLPKNAVAAEVCDALQRDILSLVELVCRSTGASRFIFRAVTASPNHHCGFHVDTVPPGAVPWGLLRVYNGAGTDYIEPSNVKTTQDFYRYLSRRERLVRDWCNAKKNEDMIACDSLMARIAALDKERAFLKRPGDVFTVPSGCIVAFKHLDIRLHWSNHTNELAWLHCSPMQGAPRFLVNISPCTLAAKRRSDFQSADMRARGGLDRSI